jgi:hypothetical protein
LPKDRYYFRRFEMLQFNKMYDADEDAMGSFGYYGNGWLYDTERPAKWSEFDYNGKNHVIVCAHNADEQHWFCEDDDCTWTATAATPDLAIAEELCMIIAADNFDEYGCEDGVNITAYGVFSMMYRDADVAETGDLPKNEFEEFMLDVCMGYARMAVKQYARDEWEDF